jgi:SAM-dependent methyltransferase
MTMTTGERQYGQLSEIRKDHLARYEFATRLISPNDVVIDAACGCGYGSYLLAGKAFHVFGYDNSQEALDYAMNTYRRHNIDYLKVELPSDNMPELCDTAVCFETIEHVTDPLRLLITLRQSTDRLFASVPNQNRIQFDPKRFPFHHRHYTKGEFDELLTKAGWTVRQWYGQEDAWSDVEKNVNGRTLVVECV